MTYFYIAKHFSRTPGGRFKTDGPHSGEAFREDFLIPWLTHKRRVTLDLDYTFGYSSAWLNEVFAPLKERGFTSDYVLNRITLVSRHDPTLITEIKNYLKD